MTFTQKNEQEYLDSPDVLFKERSFLLAEIDRTNKILGVYWHFKKYFLKWLNERPQLQSKTQTIRLLEIGGGSGGLAIQLIPFLKRHGYTVDYHILDIHTDVLEWAQNRALEKGHRISIHNGGDQHLKIFDDKSFDIVISLHTLHHIHPSAVLEEALRDTMRLTKYGFFMMDLVRRWDCLLILKIIKPFLRIPTMLYQDGVKSVRRSYTGHEMHSILERSNKDFHFKTHIRLLLNPYQIISGIIVCDSHL